MSDNILLPIKYYGGMQVIIQACNIIFESGRGADSSKKSHQAEKEGKIKKVTLQILKFLLGERGVYL